MSKTVNAVGINPLHKANALSLQRAAIALRDDPKYGLSHHFQSPEMTKLLAATKLTPAEAGRISVVLKSLGVTGVSNFPVRGRHYGEATIQM